MAAMKSSTVTPAAPTSARWYLERNVLDAEASDIGDRQQHQQNDAKVMDLAAAGFGGGGVAHFVEGLQQREDEVQRSRGCRWPARGR